LVFFIQGGRKLLERAVKAKKVERDCGYVRVLTLLWKHRLVLLLSLIVSAAVATPFALRSQATYTSTAALFLPSADPVAGIVSTTSALSAELQGYAAQELREDVRTDAGADAGKIVSLSTEVDQNADDIYTLTARAQTAAMATTTVQFGATRLINKAADLLEDELGRFRENISEEISAVYREKRRWANLIPEQEGQVDEIVSQLEGLDEDSPEAGPLEDDLARERDLLNSYQQQRRILEQEQKNLINLPADVGAQVAVSRGVARLVSGPTNPAADTQTRVVQLVGAAVMAGLLAAVLLTLWLERAALRDKHRDPGHDISGPHAVAERSSASNHSEVAGQAPIGTDVAPERERHP
jgi:uncharacterized protein involved in exopolysaccharide biosynthesis